MNLELKYYEIVLHFRFCWSMILILFSTATPSVSNYSNHHSFKQIKLPKHLVLVRKKQWTWQRFFNIMLIFIYNVIYIHFICVIFDNNILIGKKICNYAYNFIYVCGISWVDIVFRIRWYFWSLKSLHLIVRFLFSKFGYFWSNLSNHKWFLYWFMHSYWGKNYDCILYILALFIALIGNSNSLMSFRIIIFHTG